MTPKWFRDFSSQVRDIRKSCRKALRELDESHGSQRTAASAKAKAEIIATLIDRLAKHWKDVYPERELPHLEDMKRHLRCAQSVDFSDLLGSDLFEAEETALEDFLKSCPAPLLHNRPNFVDPTRIAELESLTHAERKFDVRRLVAMCRELNDAYRAGQFFSVAFLLRATIDHVPPVFGRKNFEEVVNNYPGLPNSSVKKAARNLNDSLKKIADDLIHSQIREVEVLPTEARINFGPDLDLVLTEVVRELRHSESTPRRSPAPS